MFVKVVVMIFCWKASGSVSFVSPHFTLTWTHTCTHKHTALPVYPFTQRAIYVTLSSLQFGQCLELHDCWTLSSGKECNTRRGVSILTLLFELLVVSCDPWNICFRWFIASAFCWFLILNNDSKKKKIFYSVTWFHLWLFFSPGTLYLFLPLSSPSAIRGT